jgi:hypothetical protein
VKELKGMIVSVDFSYDVFKNIHDQLQRSKQYDHEKLKFQGMFSSAYAIVGKLMLNFAGQRYCII